MRTVQPVESEDSPAEKLSSAMETAWTELETSGEGVEAEPPSDRDESGRFAKKEAAPEQTDIDQPATDGAEKPAENVQEGEPPIEAPKSWSAEEKADFALLPRPMQEKIAKREMERDQGFNRALEKERREVSDVLRAIEPFKEQLQLSGKSAGQIISQWSAAEQFLNRDPVRAIAYLMEHHGVDPSVYIQSQQQEDPIQRQIDQRLAPLEQRIAEREAMIEQQQMAALESAVEAFAVETTTDGQPKRPFLEEVIDDMLVMLPALRERKAYSSYGELLNDAYDRAVGANPTTRARVFESLRKEEEAKRIADTKAKAAQAQKDKLPEPGKPGGINVQSKPKSLQERLEAEWNKLSN